VNEPVANSCRTCGKWPSLFDLQDSLVEDVERVDTREPAPGAPFPPDTTVLEPEVYEPETFEQEPFDPAPLAPEPEPVEPHPYELEEETDDEARERSGRRQLLRLVVPLAIVAWIVISNILNR
jgi:hypothetical protein